ncbi:MAG: 23S rRNA (adenine(2503)-C(2))-methyltransferase RlmN [Candidatus Omnitrophota bacterium]
MMKKIDIKDLSKKELEDALEKLGARRYRAAQVWSWLYKRGAGSFDKMSDLPEDLRRKLKEAFHITRLVLLDSRRSSADGTVKYLFKLEDGNTIETVFIPEGRRGTICLSSQVGCKFRCSFCASAPFGFVRNLRASEIIDEVLSVKEKNPLPGLTNLVFMGIGEPLDNYANLMKAVRVLNDKDAFGIGARKITISTCGMIPKIKKLEEEGIQVELSVSLHSADDRVRSGLVPINTKYPLAELIDTCREYTAVTGRIVTFEYVLLKGINSSEDDALKLVSLLKGLNCKVNTIAYNQIKAKGFEPPSAREIKLFIETLKAGSVQVTHRKSKGEDIDAGCGQLRIARM